MPTSPGSINRRRFLATEAASGSAPWVAACEDGARSASSRDVPTVEELNQTAATPVLRADEFTSPVVVESMRLLEKDGEYFVHVRSADGAEGISVTNSRAALVYPIFNDRVAPFFLSKDVRQLEDHLWELYRYRSNYKWQGLAFWCAQAYAEFAILDMLGRVANRSLGELLGGVVRTEVPYYIASAERETTPEEEVEHLQRPLEESGARAVKYRWRAANRSTVSAASAG